MRCLIAEHDLGSISQLQKMLSPYASCDLALSGRQALEAFHRAHEAGARYDLVCLDLKLPELDGQAVLKGMRQLEKSCGSSQEVPIVLTTGYLSPREMIGAYYYGGCTDFLVRPFRTEKLVDLLISYGLVGAGEGAAGNRQ